MVSRLPVLSGKRVGKRIAPEMVLPVFVGVVLFVALLIAYPWPVLTIGTVIYLASLPVGWLSYREHARKDAAAAAQARAPAEPQPVASAATPPVAAAERPNPEAPARPARLN
jgi:CDP-diacylglycerol--serine O-phosphatidyltransferase